MQPDSIKKYLKSNGRYSPLKSESVREVYKNRIAVKSTTVLRVSEAHKQNLLFRLINTIFKQKQNN